VAAVGTTGDSQQRRWRHRLGGTVAATAVAMAVVPALPAAASDADMAVMSVTATPPEQTVVAGQTATWVVTADGGAVAGATVHGTVMAGPTGSVNCSPVDTDGHAECSLATSSYGSVSVVFWVDHDGNASYTVPDPSHRVTLTVLGGAVASHQLTPVTADNGVTTATGDFPAMSSDGRYVAWSHIMNQTIELWDRDAQSSTILSADAPLFSPQVKISGDGHWVAYPDAGGLGLVDTQTGTASTISAEALAAAGNAPAPNGTVFLSHTGRYAAYSVYAPDANGDYKMMTVLVDRGADDTGLASATVIDGAQGVWGISGDGAHLLVSHAVADLGDTLSRYDVATGTYSRVDVPSSGIDPQTGYTSRSAISGDGTVVVFSSSRPLAPGYAVDANGNPTESVYRHDVATGATTLVAPNATAPSISDNGRWVSYETLATGGGSNAFVVDTSGGRPVRVSTTPAGGVADGPAATGGTAVSNDGRYVAFGTASTNLVGEPGGVTWFACPDPLYEIVTGPYQDGCGIGNIYVADRGPAGVTQTVTAGGTVSYGTTTSSTNPVIAAVTSPVPGTVTITPESPATVPATYNVLGSALNVDAPVATWQEPLSLTFTIDGSVLQGVDTNTVTVDRNGVPVGDCLGSSTAIPPDASSTADTAGGYPCVTARVQQTDGSVTLTVLTPHASIWQPVAAPRASYPFRGFFAPVSSTGLTTVKQGSSLPLKFSVGGYKGPGVVRAASMIRIACPGGSPVEATSVALKANALSYDKTNQQYVYTWRTPTKVAGTCARTQLALDDGSYHSALVKFSG